MPGLDGGQIYHMMTNGLGSGDLHNASSGWTSVGPIYEQAHQKINDALRDSQVTWQGAAAEAAAGGLSPLANWAMAASDEARKMASTTSDQAGNFDNTVKNLEPPPSIPEKPWYNSVAPWETDYDAAMKAKAANDMHNTEILSRYGQATMSTMNGIGQFPNPGELEDGDGTGRQSFDVGGAHDTAGRHHGGTGHHPTSDPANGQDSSRGGSSGRIPESPIGDPDRPGRGPGEVHQQITDPPGAGFDNPGGWLTPPTRDPGLRPPGLDPVHGNSGFTPGPRIPGGLPPGGRAGGLTGSGDGGFPRSGGLSGGGTAGSPHRGFGPDGHSGGGGQRLGVGGSSGLLDDHGPNRGSAGGAAGRGPGVGGPAMSGMGGAMGAGAGRGTDDERHETPDYLICEENTNAWIGELPKTVPPVIGA